MALTLVRHTTPAVAAGTCYGRTDLALADSFEDEADRVLQTLPSATVVLTSPLQRCTRLARRISDHAELELRPSSGWIEMDFGAWEGVPWADIPRDSLDAWAADFDHFNDHGGESVAMLERRVRAALTAAPPNAIVVTHAGCIKAACAIYGLHQGWNTETVFGGSVTLD
ncbi:histidine phosphatase family protein [Marivita sp. S2033]|uniref:histidine phosphatase family protein n=1 Tax=Marivita sp. S2033 TaxID=3373187 RepID=UPI003982891E